MISFIIIGKNIKHTIRLCIDSVFNFVEKNKIQNSEIIYVDSESTDGTIELIKDYPINILRVTGEVNAAIGRNEGAKYSSGNILFFIDGDMEIVSDFFPVAFESEEKLRYPFCSGDFSIKFYDYNHNYLYDSSHEIRKKTDKPIFLHISGGLFIVERKYWEKLNGMDNRLNRNQDLDFGIRMSKNKTPLLRYNELLAIHHTIEYFNKDRFSTIIKSNFLMFYGVLIRKHIFYWDFFKMLIRSRYQFIVLFLTIYNLNFIYLYMLIEIFRTFFSYKRNRSILFPLLFRLLSDVYCLFGIFFFYPTHNNYQLHIIKGC